MMLFQPAGKIGVSDQKLLITGLCFIIPQGYLKGLFLDDPVLFYISDIEFRKILVLEGKFFEFMIIIFQHMGILKGCNGKQAFSPGQRSRNGPGDPAFRKKISVSILFRFKITCYDNDDLRPDR